MLEKRITEDMKNAMRSGDKTALSAIRMLKSALKDRQIELRRDLDEQEVIAVIGKQVKQRREAAEKYAEVGRADLQAGELREVEIYTAYLPEPLTESEVANMLEEALQETGASSPKDMGQVMTAMRSKTQGRADMKQVSALVKARLAG